MKLFSKKCRVSIASIMLVFTMMLLTSCGGGGKTQSGAKPAGPIEVTFPLEKPETITFMLPGTQTTTFEPSLAKNKLWQKLKADTNVDIKFQFLGDNPSQKLSLMIGSKGYGDVLWGGPILNSFEASKYIASGMLLDLTPYINETLTPNLYRTLQDKPAAWSMITATDGKVYTIPKITDIEGWYLEGSIWINKAWLDKLGLKIPTTLDEFTNVLRAFATKDPNGNGLNDEIPYFASTAHSNMNLEAMLGLWGLSTKNATLDAYVQVRDGKVQFVPTQPAYKEALKWYRTLYEEGLLWSECFTANADSANMKFTSTTPVIGCFTFNQLPQVDYASDYVCIAPPKVPGYDPVFWYHPAINGSNNQFFITNKCKNPSVVMKWVDQFYNIDNAVALEYGLPGEGRIEKSEDGKYSYVDLTVEEKQKLTINNPTLMELIGSGSPRAFTKKDFETVLPYSKEHQIMQNCYNVYKDYITKEPWPRPYFVAKDANRALALTTDIFYQVNTNRAKWITGQSDIDADWDGYIKKLNSIGLEEFLEIMQRGYDSFMERQK